jgi:hypothetical protein
MTDVYTEETTPSGSRFWYKNGQRHRDGDEPAAVWADGTRFWYKNGQRHRDGDEPAVILAGGAREWYKNGKEIPNPNLQSAQQQATIPTFSAFTADELIRHIDNLPGGQSSELLRAVVAKLIDSREEIAALERKVDELRDDLELMGPQE